MLKPLGMYIVYWLTDFVIRREHGNLACVCVYLARKEILELFVVIFVQLHLISLSTCRLFFVLFAASVAFTKE